MARTDGDAEGSPVADDVIIDVDVHLKPSRDELAAVIDDRFRYYLRNETLGVVRLWDPYRDRIESKKMVGLEAAREGLARFRDEFGVEYPIVNMFRKLSILPRTDLAVAQMRAANQVIVNGYIDELETHAFVTVIPNAPEASAEEIERYADEDWIVGVFWLNVASDPPVGDPVYDDIYRTAERHDLPIVYHGGVGAGSFMAEFPLQHRGVETYLEAHTVGFMWNATLSVTSLIANGTPEKFPGLDFVFVESGIEWLPYLMFRLNREYAMHREDAPLLKRQPEEYIRESFYFGTQPVAEPIDPRHMKLLLDVIGTDNLLFASDYPHWDFDNPAGIGSPLLDQLTPDQRADIRHRNASRVFDIVV